MLDIGSYPRATTGIGVLRDKGNPDYSRVTVRAVETAMLVLLLHLRLAGHSLQRIVSFLDLRWNSLSGQKYFQCYLPLPSICGTFDVFGQENISLQEQLV